MLRWTFVHSSRLLHVRPVCCPTHNPQDEDQVYIVQELCMGGSLQEYLAAKGPCREHEAAAIMQGVLDLLVECHRRHIYYGDLKPANIMLLSSDTQQPGGLLQVRAIDFGLSRSARGRALTGSSGGTPAYAAPEHAALRYGVGADVWSAGVVVSCSCCRACVHEAGMRPAPHSMQQCQKRYRCCSECSCRASAVCTRCSYCKQTAICENRCITSVCPACLPASLVVVLLQLYQMLTGRLPFWPRKTLEQVSRLPLYEIISGTRTHEVEFPRSLWAGISPAARELVSRMLDRNPATRITAKEALCHPWMCATLGFVPTPSSDTAAGAAEGLLQGGPSSVRPTLQQVSPGKGSNVSPGPLSPKRPSPSRSVLSGELPTSLLLAADMHKTSMPLLVPAAE